MRKVNNILKLLGISAIGLLIFEATMYYVVELLYRVGILSVGYILCVVLYVLTNRHEKRLESEFQALQDEHTLLQKDFANQVKATDTAEKMFNEQVEVIRELNIKLNKYEDNSIPFSEDGQPQEQGYVCPKCGKEMTRMTANTVFCDNIECSRKQWKRDKLDKGEY